MRPLPCVVLLIFCLIAVSSAQQTSTTTVPNLINDNGPLVLSSGVGVVGVPAKMVGVSFAIYRQQEGGAPISLETQNVTPDAMGHSGVLLGSTGAEGIPSDLSNTQEQRWFGVQVQGQAEQPRVLLVSVPYAMKAADAETVGGLPPSAFVLSQSSSVRANETPSPGSVVAPGLAGPIGGGGTLNNRFTGAFAGTSSPSPFDNTFAGAYALNSNTKGLYNTFTGYSAGTSNTTGYNNTFEGYQAGPDNVSGTNNTFLGKFVLLALLAPLLGRSFRRVFLGH